MSLGESKCCTSKSKAPQVIMASVRPARVWDKAASKLQDRTTTFSSGDFNLDTNSIIPWAVRLTWSLSVITRAKTTT